MRKTEIIMGMPITIEIVATAPPAVMEGAFDIFIEADQRFSTYKPESEISRLNRGLLTQAQLSAPALEVFALAEATRQQSDGYFNMRRQDGLLDPSGIVKGWAIKRAADYLQHSGIADFCIDAAGDIQTCGLNAEGAGWRIGIRSPFVTGDIIKVVEPCGQGVATSGSYIRGAHIWNPKAPTAPLNDVVSLTVIGPDVLEADRFATAAFAMGADGIYFIEDLPGFEAYQVNGLGVATETTGFGKFVAHD